MLELAGQFINNLALDQLVTTAGSLTSLTVTDQTRLLTEAIVTLCRIRPDAHTLLTLSEWHKIQLVDLFGDSLPYVREVLGDVWRNRHTLRDCTYSVAVLKALSRTVVRHDALTRWCLNNIERHFERSLEWRNIVFITVAYVVLL